MKDEDTKITPMDTPKLLTTTTKGYVAMFVIVPELELSAKSKSRKMC